MLRGVGIGAGYFSKFHYDAWNRIEGARIDAIADPDPARRTERGEEFGITRTYADYREMLDSESPDFVDIITRPETHLEICQEATSRGIPIICQKPVAPTADEARKIIDLSAAANVRLMIHENFRFQPWHREIKKLIGDGLVGNKLHQLHFRCRTGDGWPENAYMDRQPYFREMPRLLIYETGVHFIDTFRFLAGEVEKVYCKLKRLNQAIAGEDCGLLWFEFESGATGLWDANRYNESSARDTRYTFGELSVEADGGTIRLDEQGNIQIQPLGQPAWQHEYRHARIGFAGDCCRATQEHFISGLDAGTEWETEGNRYWRNIEIQEAFYESNDKGMPITV